MTDTFTPDEEPTDECACDSHDAHPNPLCRLHGHEDVRSGAYDASPRVRARIDAEIARMGDR